jgi:hypothetical protein
VSVLQALVKASDKPGEVARARQKIARIGQAAAARAQYAAREKAQTEAQAREALEVVEVGPRHPTEPTTGPRHEALGVIRAVACSYPAAIELRVEGEKKAVLLYSNNYFKLDISALGFTPEASLNPCTGMEGMKARVQYAESSDKTIDGQIVAIELRK